MKDEKMHEISKTTVFLALSLIWLLALTFLFFKSSILTGKESWKCNIVNCTEYRSGVEWAKDNCFVANNQEVCRLVVNGVNQLVAKNSLNLTALQECMEYRCVEEIKIRNVNYKYNVTNQG